MGTWGANILDDDFAREVESAYLERLYAGDDDQQASDRVITEFTQFTSGELSEMDVDEHCVFWLSLARVQYEYGRLVATVKDRALQLIDSGEDLKRWANDNGRARALKALARKLVGPTKTKIALPKRAPKLFEGDIFRLPLLRDDLGRYAFGRVLTDGFLAFYRLTSDLKRPPFASIVTSDVLFVVGSTDDGFARRQWFVVGNQPIEDKLRVPIYFYHQSVGSDICAVFNIWDRNDSAIQTLPASACKDYEQWGAWSAVHCRDRVVSSLTGEPCKWMLPSFSSSLPAEPHRPTFP